MSRPDIYKKLVESYQAEDRYLATCPRLFGLMYQGDWLIQVKPNRWNKTSVKKYFRHIYASEKQARNAQQRIQQEYHIQPELVEIQINATELD